MALFALYIVYQMENRIVRNVGIVMIMTLLLLLQFCNIAQVLGQASELNTRSISEIHSNNLPGHLETLGSHIPPRHVETREDLPTPREFFENYVRPSKPVIFKGAAFKFDSLRNWNDEYLRKYSDWLVEVEVGKRENRSLENLQMSFGEFVNRYKTEELYLVYDIVPPNPIAESIPLLDPIQCGGFQNSIQSAVMWFSSGKTQSLLHEEMVDSIECMLDGGKVYFLVDKVNSTLHLKGNEGKYIELDVEEIDMNEFPELSRVSWYRMQAGPGDCYFVPYGWFHHVNSSNSRNLAISYWMNHMYRFIDDCYSRENRKVLLSQINPSSIDGTLRTEMLEIFFGKPNITYLHFEKFFADEFMKDDVIIDPKAEKEILGGKDPKNRPEILKQWIREQDMKRIRKSFDKIDENGDGILTIDEVYNVNERVLVLLMGHVRGSAKIEYQTTHEHNHQNHGSSLLEERKKKYLRNEL